MTGSSFELCIDSPIEEADVESKRLTAALIVQLLELKAATGDSVPAFARRIGWKESATDKLVRRANPETQSLHTQSMAAILDAKRVSDSTRELARKAIDALLLKRILAAGLLDAQTYAALQRYDAERHE